VVHILDFDTGIVTAWQETGWKTAPKSEPTGDSLPYEGSYVGAVHFVGKRGLLVNRYVRSATGTFLQILRLEI